MAHGNQVKSPDGDEWIVRRRLSRKGPERPRLGGADGFDAGIEGLVQGKWAPGLEFDDGIVASLLLLVAYFVLVVLLVVLIGLAVEVIAPVLLIVYGLFAGFALRRPWTVEAVNLVEPGRSASFAVKGWRQSGVAVEALRSEIAATGSPTPPAGAEGLQPA